MTLPPLFDPDPLDRMARDIDPDFAGEILELYLSQLDELIAAIATGLRECGDEDRARRAAHNLKASSRQVGATALADLCQQVETGGSDPEGMIRRLAALGRDTRVLLEAERQPRFDDSA